MQLLLTSDTGKHLQQDFATVPRWIEGSVHK